MLYSYYTTLPKPLAENELLQLLEKYQAGDKEVLEEILLHNLLLIKYIIEKKFKGYNYEVDDLFQVGIIGLQQAVETYDIKKDVKFISYAFSCIRNEIAKFIRKEKRHQILSLDETLFESKDGDKLSYLSSLKDDSVDIEKTLCDKESYEIIKKLIADISNEHERNIMQLWFNGKNYQEIASICGISKQMAFYFIDKNIKLIKKKLQALGIVEAGLKSKKKKPIIGNVIYEYLGCSKEVFIKIYDTLDEIDKENLKLLVGDDFDKPILNSQVSRDEKLKFYNALAKIRKRLKKVLKKGSGSEMEDINFEGGCRSLLEASGIEIKKVPITGDNPLNFEAKALPSLVAPTKEPEILEPIKKSAAARPKKKHQKLVPLMELLGAEYTKEEKEQVLKELTAEEQELIILANGKDLNNPVRDASWDKKCNYLYYQLLIPKLKRHLAKRKKYSREPIKKETLDHKEKNDILPLNYEMTNATMLTLTKQILKVLEIPDYQAFLSNFSIKDIVISSLAMQLVGNNSLKEIASFFKVSEKEVFEITKKFIISYRNALNDYFDRILENIQSDFLEDTKVFRKTE